MFDGRPAEWFQVKISAAVGAALIIYGAVKDGFDMNDLTDPQVQGAIALALGFGAALKTWLVARKQRSNESPLTAANDGTVVEVHTPTDLG